MRLQRISFNHSDIPPSCCERHVITRLESGWDGSSGSPRAISNSAYLRPPSNTEYAPPRRFAGRNQRRPSPTWTKTYSQRAGSRCLTTPLQIRLPPFVHSVTHHRCCRHCVEVLTCTL